MSVKNNFPNIDSVLRRLREYVRFFEEKKGKEIDEEEAKENLAEVDTFIEAVENYLDSVCNDEKRVEKFKSRTDSREDIQNYIGELDDKRTRNHSQIISQMAIIDRITQLYGLDKVFDYLEEFEKNTAPLLANSWKDKTGMSSRAREKRRELGNFGLYIAAGVSVGLEMSEKEIRDFSSCEVEVKNEREEIERKESHRKVTEHHRRNLVKNNMKDMLR